MECTSHSFKAKKLHIYPFIAGLTWVKWPKDPSAQGRWNTQREGKDKMGMNDNMVNSLESPSYVPVISTRKRSALVAKRAVILSTLPEVNGGEDQKGTNL